MGTRSFIARKIANGFEGVYCHWDGYLDFNGRILCQHYTDPEKVERLIAHGDIFSLDAEIGEKHDFDDRPEGQTTFYHRDRGEDWEHVQPNQFPELEELIRYAEDCGCEYFYLFDGEDWQYAECGVQYFSVSDGSSFSELKPLPAF